MDRAKIRSKTKICLIGENFSFLFFVVVAKNEAVLKDPLHSVVHFITSQSRDGLKFATSIR